MSAGLDYNTKRKALILAEYGRNVQNMVEFAKAIEDRQERNTAARAIVTIMGQINPALMEKTELESKLWVHMYIISDYALDVDYPCDLPTRAEVEKKPEKLPYPQEEIRYRYYGKSIPRFIQNILQIEDAQELKKQTLFLANFMKKQYNNYNHESAEDHIIRKHLTELSKGKLVLEEDATLQEDKNKSKSNHHLKKKKFFNHKKKRNQPNI